MVLGLAVLLRCYALSVDVASGVSLGSCLANCTRLDVSKAFLERIFVPATRSRLQNGH